MPTAAMPSRVHAFSICASAAPTSAGARPRRSTKCFQLCRKSSIESEPKVKWSVVCDGAAPARSDAAGGLATRLLPGGGAHMPAAGAVCACFAPRRCGAAWITGLITRTVCCSAGRTSQMTTA